MGVIFFVGVCMNGWVLCGSITSACERERGGIKLKMIDSGNQTNVGHFHWADRALRKVKGEARREIACQELTVLLRINYTSPPSLFCHAVPAHGPFLLPQLGWPVREMQGKGWDGTKAESFWW